MMQKLQEYWVNVYEYVPLVSLLSAPKTAKCMQFYSSCFKTKSQAEYYAENENSGRCVYRICVRMKDTMPKMPHIKDGPSVFIDNSDYCGKWS